MFLDTSQLSSAKRLSNAIQSLDPILYYPLNELSGDAINHAKSTKGRFDGIVSGAIQGVMGSRGRGYAFSGTGATNKITIPDHVDIRFETTGVLSWCVLFNLSQMDNNVLPRFWAKGSHYGCFMGDRSNGRFRQLAMEFVDNTAAVAEYWSTTRLDINKDYFAVFTFDTNATPTTMGKVYINGVAENMVKLVSDLNGTILSTAGSNLALFNSGGNNRSIAANYVQHIAYFNKVLTQDEITKLANAAGIH